MSALDYVGFMALFALAYVVGMMTGMRLARWFSRNRRWYGRGTCTFQGASWPASEILIEGPKDSTRE
jgi:hypothetical protein